MTQQIFQDMAAEVFARLGEDVVYTPAGGEAATVKAVLSRPDLRVEGFGRTVVSASAIVEFLVADVVQPQPGDLLEIAGEDYTIQGQPQRDDGRLVWRCEAVPQT